MEFLPDIVPVLITALQDSTPAVARQSGTCGIDLFRSTLVRIAIQVSRHITEYNHLINFFWYTCMQEKDEYVFWFRCSSRNGNYVDNKKKFILELKF